MNWNRFGVVLLVLGTAACGRSVVEAPDGLTESDVTIRLVSGSFALQGVGSESVQNVVIANSNRRVTAVLRHLHTDPPFFVDELASPLSIPPRSSVTVQVYFRPTAPGVYNGVLICLLDSIRDKQLPLAGEAEPDEPPAPGTNSALLAWDENPEGDLGGYLVYVRESSRTFADPIANVSAASYEVTGLASATTYFFAVSAYDSMGIEGPKSIEVTKSFP
ncbi:MAG: fibronectin type III domain-containing protein [Myxococcota bacterium]